MERVHAVHVPQTTHSYTKYIHTKKGEKKTGKKRKTAKESLVCNNACYFAIEKGSRE